MEEYYFKRALSVMIFVALLILAFLVLRPIALSIISGLILAFIFSPVFKKINNNIKNRNISAGLIVFAFVTLLIIPAFFLTPLVLNQSIKIYSLSKQVDFREVLGSVFQGLEQIFPSFVVPEDFVTEIGASLDSFATKTTSLIVNSISEIFLNFPSILLQLFVMFFVFFFVMKDNEEFIAYLKSLLPFSKDIEKKLFKSSKEITVSVIYGQFIIGIVQGIIAGIGFFIFGIPNALFLTLIASIAGIFPIIGTTIVWIPVSIYLLVAGNSFEAIGILLFGLLSSTVDNFLRPLIVSRRTQLEPSIVIIGMVGGWFFFGVLGLLLGPLILAYLLILLELYRKESSTNKFLLEHSESR